MSKGSMSFVQLNEAIVNCRQCSRLIRHCQKIAKEKRRAYREQEYWGRPVPNFGTAKARLLVVGLAPGAHGANRVGRMFSGDRSGVWLFRAMHRAGFANQEVCDSSDDGLKLRDAAITNICHCAPPDNKPNSIELTRCQPFLLNTIESVKPRVFVALGGLAWKAMIKIGRESGWLPHDISNPKFAHMAEIELEIPGRRKTCSLIGSYHPSQQNTFTGRLTEPMLDNVFKRVRQLIRST